MVSPAVHSETNLARVSKKFLSSIIYHLSSPPALELGAASLQLALKNNRFLIPSTPGGYFLHFSNTLFVIVIIAADLGTFASKMVPLSN